MTRLTELEAQFIRHEIRDGRTYHVPVQTLALAQGVMFLCPKCFAENRGPVGTHMVLCWSRSRGIADDVAPKPGRWTLAGTGIDDLTLNGDPPGSARSVALTAGCLWHGFVTDGDAS